MYSYIEQLQILKDRTKPALLKQVEDFCIGKCLKKVNYYSHDNDKIAENFEAYVYYTYPQPPELSLEGEMMGEEIHLSITVSSFILLTLSEVGAYYNTDGQFNRFNDKVLFPNVYGTTNQVMYSTDPDAVYFFKPYIKTCLGIQYGDIIIINSTGDVLLDTYNNIILDTYSEIIELTY
jgi:hypothetical protein